VAVQELKVSFECQGSNDFVVDAASRRAAECAPRIHLILSKENCKRVSSFPSLIVQKSFIVAQKS